MRVIAGALGGRRLLAPRGRETRPTSDRVREALFSALADVSGAAVLDLYAGTGALGIEALSRGAARAVFVERDRAALAVLRENLQALGLEPRAAVVAQTVERSLVEVSRRGPYQLLLVDPPYADVTAAVELVGELVARGAIDGAGRVVVEHASRDAPPRHAALEVQDTRRYGDTSVSRYRMGALLREATDDSRADATRR
ncbi:MAG: 16S rRNA (guanine(966)-N(2))-methyltransferase RsmD [Polyangiaceae bacterium]